MREREEAAGCVCIMLENRLFHIQMGGERERDWWYQALALQRGMDRGGNGEMEINGSSEDKGV